MHHRLRNCFGSTHGTPRWKGSSGTQFDLFGDSANLDARWVHSLHLMHHRLRKPFWKHPMVVLGDEAQVEARFGLFRDSANLDAI